MTIEDFEIIEPAALLIQRSRAAWEAEQMAALRERRARRQPITDAEVSAWQERRGESLLPAINARAAEVRARWPKPSDAPLTYAPRSAPAPYTPEVPRALWPDEEPDARPVMPKQAAPTPSAALVLAARRTIAAQRQKRADAQKAEREERQRRAIELLNIGASIERIAAELEITEYTVRRLLRQAGVQPPAVMPPRPPQASAVPPTPSATPPAVAPPAPKASAPPKPARPSAQEVRLAQAAQRREQIAALLAEGKTDKEIAIQLKVSVSLVNKQRKQAGLPQPTKALGVPEEEWPALYRDGLTTEQIAERACRSRSHVRRKLIEAGVELRLANPNVPEGTHTRAAARRAAAAPIQTDIGIPALVQRRVRSLAADGVPARIIAKVYKLKRSDIEALLGADAAEEVAS